VSTIVLPYPPSANKLWKPIGRGKMVRTPEYKAWMGEAAWVVAMAARDQGQLIGPYRILIKVCPPTLNRRRDVGNIEKATSDAIVKGGMVEDDSLCQEIAVRWTALDEPGLMVEINATAATPCTPLSTSGRSTRSLRPSEPEGPFALDFTKARPAIGSNLTAAQYREMLLRGSFKTLASKRRQTVSSRAPRKRGDT
jgi:crossover junction endodeoxyribonuclease RusA